MIDSFRGDHAFLSNFFRYPLKLQRVIPGELVSYIRIYRSAEHAYQTFKTVNNKDFFRIYYAKTPGEAKRLGNLVELRLDWEDTKLSAMNKVLVAKFEDPYLRGKLLETGDEELVEGNNWGDRFWGKVDGEGKNWLGHLLMDLRKDLQDGV